MVSGTTHNSETAINEGNRQAFPPMTFAGCERYLDCVRWAERMHLLWRPCRFTSSC